MPAVAVPTATTATTAAVVMSVLNISSSLSFERPRAVLLPRRRDGGHVRPRNQPAAPHLGGNSVVIKAMEFRILGPLEVVGEHGPISLHRGKEQALLSFMLLHPNQVLPSERLIDELWDGRPPPTAPKILQNAVSQLRKALGGD